jgi:hypothetical protein
MKKICLSLLLIAFAFTASSQSITVVSPNGGENWTIGCPATIQWLNSSAPTTVKIELYKNNVFNMTICPQVPPTQNSFTWTPFYAVVPGNDYKVKVTSLNNTGTSDFSDGTFSINPGVINVTSPNGSEIWQQGSTHMITWTGNICENVRIELWKNGVMNSVICPSTPSTGNFSWTIPVLNTIPPAGDYKIKVMTVPNSGTTGGVSDMSDNNFTISASGSITVVSPNGGENWIIGCPGIIQWITSTSAGSVKIELYRNGVFSMIICPQVPAGQSSFTWVPPYSVVPGNDYKVKVSALANTTLFDFSDNNFSINLGNITVVSPNGSEIWQQGTQHPITWTDNICENVRIELWKNGVFNSVITAATPSNGLFNWTIPVVNTIPPASDYRVKILSLISSTGTPFVISDISNNDFTIAQGSVVTLIMPNGGENWIIGCPSLIKWMAAASTGGVKLELFKNGVFNMTICPQVPGGQNTFTWVPPATVVPGNDYKVKVSLLTNPASCDFSDASFSINGGAITVTSPNGGEVWNQGTAHPITWTDNICQNVRIELWKGNVFNLMIAQSVPSNGLFNWTIPYTASLVPGNDYKIKIVSLALAPNTTVSVYDFSDNYFTISNGPFITVTSPNGGEVWLKGTTRFITWMDNIPDSVRIELWKGGAFSMLITPATPSTGSCPWAIPATIPSGNDYKVKVLSVSSAMTLFDLSDNNFTILATNSGGMLKSVSDPAAETEFRIYPNPCNYKLSVRIQPQPETPVMIDIMSVTGKRVLSQSVQSLPEDGVLEINTGDFVNGMYIFVIRNEETILFRTALVVRHE